MVTALSEYNEKKCFNLSELSVFTFDFITALSKIKSVKEVEKVYLSCNDKLEIYIFYKKENFEVEDEITKYLTDWEKDYKYFPEAFIFPLDMISSVEDVLPKDAKEV